MVPGLYVPSSYFGSQRVNAVNATGSSHKEFVRTLGYINKAQCKSVYVIGMFALEFLGSYEDRVSMAVSPGGCGGQFSVLL